LIFRREFVQQSKLLVGDGAFRSLLIQNDPAIVFPLGKPDLYSPSILEAPPSKLVEIFRFVGCWPEGFVLYVSKL